MKFQAHIYIHSSLFFLHVVGCCLNGDINISCVILIYTNWYISINCLQTAYISKYKCIQGLSNFQLSIIDLDTRNKTYVTMNKIEEDSSSLKSQIMVSRHAQENILTCLKLEIHIWSIIYVS